MHHAITVYNDMFNFIDGIIRALAKKTTQRKEDSYFPLNFARQKLSKYHAAVAPTTDMHLISAQTHYPSRKLRSFRKWDKGMNNYP